MTQEILNNLFENYDSVEKFYFTSDTTAFKSVDDAMKHAKRLNDSTVKSIPHGGKLEDAVIVEDGIEQDLAKSKEDEETPAEEVIINKLKKDQLQKLCDLRGIEYDPEMTKAKLIELLEADAEAKAKEVAE